MPAAALCLSQGIMLDLYGRDGAREPEVVSKSKYYIAADEWPMMSCQGRKEMAVNPLKPGFG